MINLLYIVIVIFFKEESNVTLGEKIKRLRKLNNMSQQQLADYLEINRNYLSRIETNKSDPTSTIILKLTTLFEITPSILLGTNINNDQRDGKKKFIIDSCDSLSDDDLEFLIRIISLMKEEYVKRKISTLKK